MTNEKFILFDIETDGFYDQVTVLHCLVFQIYQSGNIIDRGVITDIREIQQFFNQDAYFVCHNMIRYDIPVCEKLANISIVLPKLVDTLGLSWHLFPYKKLHGLESWGEYFGVPKPKVEDWKNLSLEEYIHRCKEDVKINMDLFKYLFNYLSNIYGDFDSMMRLVGYCNFKLDCLREQEMAGITLDIDSCNESLSQLNEMFNAKTDILSSSMPKELGKILRSKPKAMFKQNGDISVNGQKWVDFTSELGIAFDSVEEVREIPNPGSNPQLKKWLYSLGWKPVTFKVSKSTGKPVEQISLPFGAGLCPSVKELYSIEPKLVELENYFKIKHRIGVFKSYFKNLKGNKVIAKAHGFTNTMRLTHSEPVVNLPKPGVFYGKEIREALTIPDSSYVMCGSDVSSLEDNTKQHYIYFYDPEYVEEMRVPGFDPHVDIGVLAGLITSEEAEWFKWADKQEDLSPGDVIKYSQIKKKRGVAKSANFAATYGAGGPKIAETAKISESEGVKLHKIYWQRNSAVKRTAKACLVKSVQFKHYDSVRTQKWLYNPISGFWMFLKADQDRFSTLNQSSGVYIFDSWLRKVRGHLKELNIPVIMQYHDELLLVCKKEMKDQVDNILHSSMEEVNEEVKLNVKISVSTDWGLNYAECH